MSFQEQTHPNRLYFHFPFQITGGALCVIPHTDTARAGRPVGVAGKRWGSRLAAGDSPAGTEQHNPGHPRGREILTLLLSDLWCDLPLGGRMPSCTVSPLPSPAWGLG